VEELLWKLRDNFGIIAFLVLALGSQLWKVVRSASGQDQQGKGKVHPMPSFGGDPGELKPDPRSMDRSRRDLDIERQALERERVWKELETEGEGVSLEGHMSIRRDDSNGSAAEGGHTGSVSALEKDELARAVMWFEILGPPRSKRPHRRT